MKEQIVITPFQATCAGAVAILLLSISFGVGYFAGARSTAIEFCHTVIQRSLADQIYHAFYAMQGLIPVEDGSETESGDEGDEEN